SAFWLIGVTALAINQQPKREIIPVIDANTGASLESVFAQLSSSQGGRLFLQTTPLALKAAEACKSANSEVKPRPDPQASALRGLYCYDNL
ncbi:MAG: hypothetical protein KJZ78_12095, partial [Bryobacteraceae bacterium]|nr:hypothetical protein [Bryobacteraceae bacterium]